MWTKVGLGIRVGGQRNKTAQPTCNLGIKHQRLPSRVACKSESRFKIVKSITDPEVWVWNWIWHNFKKQLFFLQRPQPRISGVLIPRYRRFWDSTANTSHSLLLILKSLVFYTQISLAHRRKFFSTSFVSLISLSISAKLQTANCNHWQSLAIFHSRSFISNVLT